MATIELVFMCIYWALALIGAIMPRDSRLGEIVRALTLDVAKLAKLKKDDDK